MDPLNPPSRKHPCCLPPMNNEIMPPEQAEKPQESAVQFRGFGLTLLVLAVGALFAYNSRTLWAMQSGVSADRRQALEASQPAELELTVVLPTDCPRCYDPTRLTSVLRENKRLKILSEKRVEAGSPEGQALVKELSAVQLPVVVLRGEIDKALTSAEFLSSYGRRTSDGRFAATSLPPPYVETDTRKVRGLFEAIYLTDKGCRECYDPSAHRSVLAGAGLVPDTETTVDRQAAAGKDLVKKYGIESVPTLLLRGDVAVYQFLQKVWPSVGTVESDGTYVFRSGQSQMGAYYDLKAKKLIQPETAQPEAAPAK